MLDESKVDALSKDIREGITATEAVKKHGVSLPAFYKYRKQLKRGRKAGARARVTRRARGSKPANHAVIQSVVFQKIVHKLHHDP